MIGVQRLGPVAPRHAADYRAVSDQMAGFHATAGVTERAAAAGAAPLTAGAAAPRPADLERDAWIVLLSVSGLGPVSFGTLLGAFGSARAVLEASAESGGCERLLEALAAAAATDAATGGIIESNAAVFDACAGPPAGPAAAAAPGTAPHGARQLIGRELALRICDAAQHGSAVVARVRGLGLTAVTLEEPDYPDRLRRVELPPPLLFLRGEAAAMSATHSVAVVGTRWPTDKGRLIAGWIGSALAQAGAVVVSGLAVGIDGAAHASVVAEGGRTVAVLGGGHAHLFPKAHERLAEAIVRAGGAVVSEHSPDTTPSRGTFPRRNRLVSGLSDATVVVEAGVRSGALITAGWALEQGRECFLVPGAFDSPASAGCHAFLRSFPGQARLVSGIAELIEDLEIATTGTATTAATAPGATAPEAATTGGEPSPGTTPEAAAGGPVAAGARRSSSPPASMPGPNRAAAMATLGPVERAIAELLAAGPATADQLAGRTSLASAAVLSALTLLELRGLVTAAYGRYAPSGPLAGWSGSSAAAPRKAT